MGKLTRVFKALLDLPSTLVLASIILCSALLFMAVWLFALKPTWRQVQDNYQLAHSLQRQWQHATADLTHLTHLSQTLQQDRLMPIAKSLPSLVTDTALAHHVFLAELIQPNATQWQAQVFGTFLQLQAFVKAIVQENSAWSIYSLHWQQENTITENPLSLQIIWHDTPLTPPTSACHATIDLERQADPFSALLNEANSPQAVNTTDQVVLQRVFISLRYARASDMLTLIKMPDNHLLSARGSVSADTRTNSLWLEDSSDKINSLRNFIAHLDINTPQIAIEARIVTVDLFHERDLGLQLGLSSLHHLSGTLEGANLAQKTNNTDVPVNARLNINFPANPTDSASIGVALLPIQPGYGLDLALSALETNGFGEIIASPRLLTTNLQTASIETGEDIPYQEKTSSGATNVAFKKAVLSLEVTPQILNHQQLLLTLKISQDKASSREVNGVPAIDTREIVTQVRVANGQTVVLGGIYEIDQQNLRKRIPFISDIPFIGRLFTYQHHAQQKRELLIFIRPTLVTN